MPVFKSAMKIARQNIGLILMYVAIVAMVLSLNIGNSKDSERNSYTASAMNISYVDEDNSALSRALSEHLSEIHTLKVCDNDPVRLQEDLYYRQSDCVVRVPAGFGADPAAHPLQVTEVPGSYTEVYLESQIESYLRQVQLYITAGFSGEESVSLADQARSPSVHVLEQSEQSELSLGGFFQFLPYGAICMLSFAIGNVLCAFMKTEVRKRTGASAFTYRRTEAELLLAVAVFGLAIFSVFLVMGCVFYGDAFWEVPHLKFYLSNLIVMILVSMSLSYLIAMMAKSQESLSGIINSLSLGMCFLCGVFVPLEFLGEGVQATAHFLPFYWYERGNNLLTEFSSLSGNQIRDFWGYVGIQAAFSVMFLSLGAAMHKRRSC